MPILIYNHGNIVKTDFHRNVFGFEEIWVNKSKFNKGYDKENFEVGRTDNLLGRGDNDVRCSTRYTTVRFRMRSPFSRGD
ncbi:hypothetical protein BCE02nite_53420 [Brevibacillus centrosporus]|nr:hypothetical protein BCE02nite_53420 [Brevibacillus centrosporus]